MACAAWRVTWRAFARARSRACVRASRAWWIFSAMTGRFFIVFAWLLCCFERSLIRMDQESSPARNGIGERYLMGLEGDFVIVPSALVLLDCFTIASIA